MFSALVTDNHFGPKSKFTIDDIPDLTSGVIAVTGSSDARAGKETVEVFRIMCLPSIEWNRLCPAFTRKCKYAYVMLTESAEVNMLRT